MTENQVEVTCGGSTEWCDKVWLSQEEAATLNAECKWCDGHYKPTGKTRQQTVIPKGFELNFGDKV